MYLKWRRRTRCPGFDNNGCPIKATCCIIKEKKYELCLYCLRIIKLDFEFIYLQKQHRVCRHLIDVFGKGHFVFESNLRRKSSRRVDIVKYFKETNTYLVIEIDEGQHQRHNMTKEEHRMSCLRSVGNIIFIRYNPDEYYVVGDGILNPSFEERMDVLVDEINSSFSYTNKVVSKETRSIIDQFHLYTTERDALTLYSNYYHDKFYDQDQLKKINEFLDNEYDMLNKDQEVNENEYKTQKDNKKKLKLADKLGM